MHGGRQGEVNGLPGLDTHTHTRTVSGRSWKVHAAVATPCQCGAYLSGGELSEAIPLFPASARSSTRSLPEPETLSLFHSLPRSVFARLANRQQTNGPRTTRDLKCFGRADDGCAHHIEQQQHMQSTAATGKIPRDASPHYPSPPLTSLWTAPFLRYRLPGSTRWKIGKIVSRLTLTTKRPRCGAPPAGRQ